MTMLETELQDLKLGEGYTPLYRNDDDYDRARLDRVFNLRYPERYPIAVVEARTIEDVRAGVRLAKEKKVQVAVRSGGHSWAVWSVRDNSVLIDLGHLRELSYDPETELVTCSPAITGGELQPMLLEHDRFFGGGHCPTVGVGGFLLQGGQGWGARGWGWSCEQIDSMDIVMPDGELITASEKEHADVFWAARGAGPGFFGIVVRFRLKTRPRPKLMFHVTYIIPAKDNFKKVIVWKQKTDLAADTDLESVCLSFTRARLFGKDVKEGQNPMEPMLVVRATSFSSSEDQARKQLAPYLENPARDQAEVKLEIVSTSMAEEYAAQLADNPPGFYWCQNAWVVGEPEDVADSLDKAFTTLPSKLSFFLHYSMAPLRPLPDMAFSIQSEHYVAGYIIGEKDNEKEAEACSTWLKDRFDYIDSKKDGPGGTIGAYLGDSDLATRSAKIMSDENWAKWCSIRDKHDPDHLFVGYLHGQHKLNLPAWEQ